ncbi:hypothetical protein MZB69_24155 [Escherichia coli]|uniref:hypothetical protein n=1 Tax=Escherichia coli TaxID=562 RepID=UPI001375420A|nr:hypothetical protein [Escherichia coli]MBZ9527049.1 hypothetical protein [Escherichia coli]MCQ5513177.1 hypothetical protein [Escherichia coli]MCQ5553580.1 hypothetical protein [Escherichia coli]MCQ5564833.1 hypothetical protein [Escherichia coli]MCQ5585287.1 hypothetical protein [Escherichia coli]
MKLIAYVVIAVTTIIIPTIGHTGTTQLQKYLGDKQTCHSVQGDAKYKKETKKGICIKNTYHVKCPSGRCVLTSKPSRYGQCPSGGTLNYCSDDGHPDCGEYTLERLVGRGPGKTVCTTVRGGYLKSEIIYPDEIELREGEHAEIKVKGDCTAITIGSKGGQIIPREERVCGTGNVKITKRPGAEGADYVEIKAQIVQ